MVSQFVASLQVRSCRVAPAEYIWCWSKRAQLHGKPSQELDVTGKFRSGDVRHCLAAISLAPKVLGWSPQVGLEEGLSDLLAWVLKGAAVDLVPTQLS